MHWFNHLCSTFNCFRSSAIAPIWNSFCYGQNSLGWLLAKNQLSHCLRARQTALGQISPGLCGCQSILSWSSYISIFLIIQGGPPLSQKSLMRFPLLRFLAKICIKYRKHGSSSFSHTFKIYIPKMSKVLSDGSTQFKDIHFNFLFMILPKKILKMFRRVFSLIKKICFLIQIHEFLRSLTWTNMLFWF